MKTLLYALFIAAIAVGAAIVPSSLSLADGSLSLTANVDKDKVLLGEPISVAVTLRNVGQEAIDVAPFKTAYQVYLAPEGRQFRRYSSDAELSHRWQWHKKKLNPGEEVQIRRIVLLDLEALYRRQEEASFLAITKPGKYKIKVAYRNLETEPILVQVVEPEQVDNEIWDFIRRTPEIGKAAQLGDRLPNAITAQIGSFLTKYPQSAYREYLMRLVGK